MASFLSEQLREKIIECVDKKIIDKNDTFELWKASNEEDLIKILTNILRVSDDEKKNIWLYIVDNYWKNVNDIFGKNEIMLLKTIIKYNGVISRIEILKKEKTMSVYGLNTSVTELEEYGVVDKIQLTNSKILYVISSKVLNAVRVQNE